MSLYPILWAVEHAPVRDAEERSVLVALVMKGSFDGRDCHRSYKTLGHIARVDRKTAERKCRAMEARGLLRRQTGQMPVSWKRLPADKKTVVWEVMIPADFWSPVQLEEINTARTERGLPPITRDNRPPLAPAPPKHARADKGKPAPQRRPKSLPPKNDETGPGKATNETKPPESAERGDSQSRRSDGSGGTDSPVAGGLTVPSRGDSQSPNPPYNPPIKTSSSSSGVTPAADRAAAREDVQEEEGTARAGTDMNDGTLTEALAVVDTATEQWDGHRLPTPSERLRLAERVADALAQGARRVGVHDALTRDLEPSRTRSAVAVVMSRTSRAGWAELPGVGRGAAAGRPQLPPKCDRCDVNRMVETDDGRVRRCPACHPNGSRGAAIEPDEPERVVWDVIDLEAV
ncbi:hypothetical protein [Actinomadura terrae]|uniref:hypothetical protein n=1 Tax=Actinomadura terrae TaxID=604353 RepID=UPI001FA6F83E|nr:hypothetical protein [Actinomadura terrae]